MFRAYYGLWFRRCYKNKPNIINISFTFAEWNMKRSYLPLFKAHFAAVNLSVFI